MDNVGYKAFGIDENATADKLKTMVTDKLGLKEDACFAIFEKKEGWGEFSSSKKIITSRSFFLHLILMKIQRDV